MGFLKYVLASLGVNTKEESSTTKTTKEATNNAAKKTLLKHKCTNKLANNNFAIFCPKNLNDLGPIAKFFSTGQQALLNFEKVEPEVFQRVLDFIAGAVCAVGGKVQNLGNKLFLFAPKNTKILNKGNGYEN